MVPPVCFFLFFVLVRVCVRACVRPVQLLCNYQRWRRDSPELSGCLSPSSVLGLLHTSYHAVLPQRDHAGSRVLLYRIGGCLLPR